MIIPLMLSILLLLSTPESAFAQDTKVDVFGNPKPCSYFGGYSKFDACHIAAARAQLRSHDFYSTEFVQWACSPDYTRLEEYVSANNCSKRYKTFITTRTFHLLETLYPKKGKLPHEIDQSNGSLLPHDANEPDISSLFDQGHSSE